MTDAELHWLESNNAWRKLARRYARPTSWFDDDLEPSTVYRYLIVAVDTAGVTLTTH